MPRSTGGFRRDPAREEFSTIDRDPKRVGDRGWLKPLSVFPAARMVQTVAQAVGNGAWTTITMDSAADNGDVIYNLATEQIIAKYAAVYLLLGLVHFTSQAAPGAADSRYARFFINNTTPVAESGGFRIADGARVRVQCHYLTNLARGDTVALQGFQGSGANLNTFVTDNASFLAAVMVAPSMA